MGKVERENKGSRVVFVLGVRSGTQHLHLWLDMEDSTHFIHVNDMEAEYRTWWKVPKKMPVDRDCGPRYIVHLDRYIVARYRISSAPSYSHRSLSPPASKRFGPAITKKQNHDF